MEPVLKKLSQFYERFQALPPLHLQGPLAQDEYDQWLSSIEMWIKHLNDLSTLEHADVLIIETQEKKYKQQDFEELTSFLGHRPWQLARQWVWIKEAHKLTPSIVNRLLKAVEALGPVQWVFCSPLAKAPMATLQSRLAHFNLTGQYHQAWSFSESEFLENLVKKNLEWNVHLPGIIESKKMESLSFVELQSILKDLKEVDWKIKTHGQINGTLLSLAIKARQLTSH